MLSSSPTTRVTIRGDAASPPPPPSARAEGGWRDALAVILWLWLLLGVSIWVLYLTQFHELRTRTQGQLMDMAEVAAGYVDVEKHKAFVSPDQENSQEYRDAIAKLAEPLNMFRRMHKTYDGVKFIYTLVYRGQDYYFILDPTPAGDSDGDGVDDKSHVMERYDDPSPAVMRALREGVSVADEAPYSDKWGSFISGYCPLIDKKGEAVGIVGVDINASVYLQAIRDLQYDFLQVGLIGALVCIAVGAVIGLHSAGLRRQIRSQYQRAVESGRALDALRRSQQSRDEAIAAHVFDLRSALHSIDDLLRAAATHAPGQAEWRRDMEAAHYFTQEIHHELADTYDALRHGQGRARRQTEAFQTGHLIEELVAALRPLAPPGIDIRCREPNKETPLVIGDAPKLRQMLLHFLYYVLRHGGAGTVEIGDDVLGPEVATPPEGEDWPMFRIRPLSSEIPGHHLRLRLAVRADGLTISKARLGTLFGYHAPTLDDLEAHAADTDIGMAICRRMAEATGAEVGIASRHGAGTIFWIAVDLPVV